MADQADRVRVFAPAKINLTLHVTGQRSDGYHLLDSLVVFADVGDHLTVDVQDGLSMRVDGLEAVAVPAGVDNLVLRIAALFKGLPGAGFHLSKELPVSSGIGGGSADAAAAFRALTALLGKGVAPDMADVLRLGADIPMCIGSNAARVRGIGDRIEPLTDLPPLHCVLVNPRRAVSTPMVFKALHNRNQPEMPETLPQFSQTSDMAAWLATQRNDLELAAMSLEPAIAQVKAALEGCKGCMLARMSGSGATCFGLFADHQTAHDSAVYLREAHPEWWIRPASLGAQGQRAAPQLIRSTT